MDDTTGMETHDILPVATNPIPAFGGALPRASARH
jgi:hypothetical protein